MNSDVDMRECPVCKEPVNVEYWHVYEANCCDSCGAYLYLDARDNLHVAPEVVF